MYRTCIFCSADLGTNDSLEAFPVSKSIAFDGWKGRLWAICPKCARWNLAPLEERWEAVEAADRLFTDARLRVQSENVGLARLRDGTRLIRIGQALPGEMAAWRYGDQLVKRRRHYLLVTGAAAAAGMAILGGFAWLTATGGFYSLVNVGASLYRQKKQRKVVYRLPAERSPTGREVLLRRWHAAGSVLRPGVVDGIALVVPDAARKDPRTDGWGKPKYVAEPLVLPDVDARAFLNRAMVHLNESGASRRRLEGAVSLLGQAGSAEDFLRRTAAQGRSLGKRRDMPDRALAAEGALALEMALHEEQERRVMAGELSLLESAWREAEEIASIADKLALSAGAELG
ncbi:hypothetical protein [Longimicrobium sp.]|uniref:hypothetical protein n=1 Tax=Longimicrobium sp. TaxID=2029185 RepID=UPI002C577245|nr:hypothetical protein [Longimicrobium sp.]HSU17283.1 hypothetical protein [Longimicrobium sp.]